MSIIFANYVGRKLTIPIFFVSINFREMSRLEFSKILIFAKKGQNSLKLQRFLLTKIVHPKYLTFFLGTLEQNFVAHGE